MRRQLPTFASVLLSHVDALHHMKRQLVPRQNTVVSTPLVVTNNCADTIYPGIATQHGVGPGDTGFELTAGSTRTQTVSEDWQGRIWGRTNCTFNAQGRSNGGGPACSTGDCNGVIPCQAAVTFHGSCAKSTFILTAARVQSRSRSSSSRLMQVMARLTTTSLLSMVTTFHWPSF